MEGEVVLWKDRCERKRRAAESERQQAVQKQERRSLQDRCYNLLASRPRITLSGLLGTPGSHHALVIQGKGQGVEQCLRFLCGTMPERAEQPGITRDIVLRVIS